MDLQNLVGIIDNENHLYHVLILNSTGNKIRVSSLIHRSLVNVFTNYYPNFQILDAEEVVQILEVHGYGNNNMALLNRMKNTQYIACHINGQFRNHEDDKVSLLWNFLKEIEQKQQHRMISLNNGSKRRRL